ncbi:MAG: cache domain-containing protein, partial [Anaerolineae bacterium]|nr:cache domain-containing protein [Anaerolineae bacterium]
MVVLPGNSTAHTLAERLLRRIVPVLALMLSVYILAGVLANIFLTRQRIEATLDETLSRTGFTLEIELEPYVRLVRDLASDGSLRAYLALLNMDINAAAERARAAIDLQSDVLLNFRLIDLDSRVRLEVRNDNGVPVMVSTSEITRIDTRTDIPLFDRAAFVALVEGGAQQVVLGPLRELRDADGRSYQPPRAALALYTGVYSSSGFLAGIVRLELDTRRVLDVVNRAGQNLIEPAPGRSLVLVDRAGRVIADSSAPAREYLTELAGSAGNTRGVPVYETVSQLALAGQTVSADVHGGSVVSMHTITFAGTEAPGWQLFYVDSFWTVYSGLLSTLVLLVGLGVALALVGVVLLRRSVQPLLLPVTEAGVRLQRVAGT